MLRNRKDVEEKKLLGVNRVADPTKLKPGTFVELANWIPAKRYKLKKKRGVEALVDSPPTPVIPTNCGVCEAALPGTQSLPVVCCYDSLGFGDLSTNNHGMFAFAATDGSFWHVATENSAATSGPYPIATPSQTWYLLEPTDPTDHVDCLLQEVTAIALPSGRTADFESTQTPQGGTCGKSDEKSYILRLANLSAAITTVDNGPGYVDGGSTSSAWAYFGETTGVQYLFSAGNGIALTNQWCKFGTYFYSFESLGGAIYLARWPLGTTNRATYQDLHIALTSALPGWSNATFNVEHVNMLHATTNYVYVLATGAWSGGASHTRIYKLNRSDLTYVTHWSLASSTDFSSAWGIHVFSDDLIFIIQGAGTWKIGYFLPSDGSTTLIGSLTNSCTNAGNVVGAPGQSAFFYSMNYFYLSYSGFGLGNTNVIKIGPLLCPGQTSIVWES